MYSRKIPLHPKTMVKFYDIDNDYPWTLLHLRKDDFLPFVYPDDRRTATANKTLTFVRWYFIEIGITRRRNRRGHCTWRHSTRTMIIIHAWEHEALRCLRVLVPAERLTIHRSVSSDSSKARKSKEKVKLCKMVIFRITQQTGVKRSF